MKLNTTKLLMVVLVVGLIAAMFVGCNSKDKVVGDLGDIVMGDVNGSDSHEDKSDTPDELSKETELQIKQAYLATLFKVFPNNNWAVGDIVIAKYYGVYSGCFVVIIDVYGIDYPCVMCTQCVAEIELYYGSPNFIIVYENGRLYDLDEAYEHGLFTKNELRSIAEAHNAWLSR